MLYPVQNRFRNCLDLSGIWDFRTDPEGLGEKEGWPMGFAERRPIAVPGSWNEQYEDLYGYFGLSWYLKRSFIPSSWEGQRIFLRVGSANYSAMLYVNGKKVGSHEGGHLPFSFEISQFIDWDHENLFVIAVENELRPERVPSGNMPNSSMGMMSGSPSTTFDFYPFAGIHRPVVLYSLPSQFISDCRIATTFKNDTGIVDVTICLDNGKIQKNPTPIEGTASLFDSTGVLVGKTRLSFFGEKAAARIEVAGVQLWSNKNPYLYELQVSIAGDEYSIKVGIRTIAVKGGQILLNGNPVHLKGFGRHEDFPASGRGLNLPLIIKDYRLMKWIGANSYRTSHYPYSEEEMQLADREGFLIIDEIPAVSLQFDNETNIALRLSRCLSQIDEMIQRDKNHPSVIMWSVANEPMPHNLSLAGTPGGGNTDPATLKGKNFLDTLIDHARSLDLTRPVTIATVMGGPSSWVEKCDVVCMNRYWGWYVLGGRLDEAMVAFESEIDQTWKLWRKPIIITEFGADTLAGAHGLPNLMWTEEYQAECLSRHIDVANKKFYVAGVHIWNFADFAAVQSILRVGGMNLKGVFTRTRSPKLAAHTLRRLWVGGEKLLSSDTREG